MGELTTLLHNPIGIGSIVLIALAAGLFVWNLCREELSHEQWEIIKKDRLPDLEKLSTLLEEYKNRTNEIAETDALYDLTLYGLTGKTANELYAAKLFYYNKSYTDLQDNDERLKLLKSDIEMYVSKLGNKKLKKHIHKLYKREQVAHAFSIFRNLYKTHYKPASIIERVISRSNCIPLVEQAFIRVYEWISVLKRGSDL